MHFYCWIYFVFFSNKEPKSFYFYFFGAFFVLFLLSSEEKVRARESRLARERNTETGEVHK